jgi:putative pyrroloquinoline-quinone binding quinoprotein
VVVLIELGEDRGAPAWRTGPGRWSRNRRAAIVLAVCAVALSGLPAAPVGGFVLVAAVPAVDPGAVLLTGSSLFVAEASGRRLSAYALPGGDLRWRARLTNPVHAVQATPDTGVVLATVYGGDPVHDGLYAFDLDTGARLWTQPGTVPLDTPPGGGLLLQHETMAGAVDLRWVDARTGGLVWVRSIDPDADVTSAHDPARPGPGAVLVTGVDGHARLLAEDAGTVLVEGQIGTVVGDLVLTPGYAPATDPPGRANRTVGGASDPAAVMMPGPTGTQVLIQHRRDGTGRSMTAFAMNTLARRWSLSTGVPGAPSSCAGLLCLDTAEGLAAVDPVTGTPAWRTSGWHQATPLGGGWLLAHATSGHDRLAVLDPRTGRLVRDLPEDWAWVVNDGSDPPVLARIDGPADRYWLARLGLDPVTVRSIGPLTDIDPDSCQPSATMLACRTRHGQVRVWRLPPVP